MKATPVRVICIITLILSCLGALFFISAILNYEPYYTTKNVSVNGYYAGQIQEEGVNWIPIDWLVIASFICSIIASIFGIIIAGKRYPALKISGIALTIIAILLCVVGFFMQPQLFLFVPLIIIPPIAILIFLLLAKSNKPAVSDDQQVSKLE